MNDEIIYHDLIDAKIYRELDGKYFAIEKKKGKSGPKRKYPEKLIEVIENEPISEPVCEDDNSIEEGVSEATEAHSTPNTTRLMPIRKYFDELYVHTVESVSVRNMHFCLNMLISAQTCICL
jgi:hypothetical protein